MTWKSNILTCNSYLTTQLCRTFAGIGHSVHIQNTRMCYAILIYLESKTSNKCKRVLKKGRCCRLQLCPSERTASPSKCSLLTVFPCQSSVYTCLVALLNGEDSAVRLAVLNCRKDAPIYLGDGEVTREESKTKRVASLKLSKQIFCLLHMRHYIRALCSQPDTNWNGYAVGFIDYLNEVWTKQIKS